MSTEHRVILRSEPSARNRPGAGVVLVLLLAMVTCARADNPPAGAPAPAALRSATAEEGRVVSASALGACIRRAPPYPEFALRNDQQGRTTLTFEVSVNGVAGQAAVLRSSQFPVLDAAALRHLQQCIALSAGDTDGTLPPGRYVLPWEWRIE